MRKLKTIKIDDREITVKELRVSDIIGLFGSGQSPDVMSVVAEALPRCSDVTLEDLKDMAPSEIETIYEAFREVNAVFFKVAGQMGLDAILEELKASIRKEFSGALADSFRPATPTA